MSTDRGIRKQGRSPSSSTTIRVDPSQITFNTNSNCTQLCTFASLEYQYTITKCPTSISKPVIWMRSVYRHQLKQNISKTIRQLEFSKQFGNSTETTKVFNRRYKTERDLHYAFRIKYQAHKIDATKHLISTQEADRRARKRIKRAINEIKHTHRTLNNNVATVTRFGIMKSSGKYDTFRRVYKSMSQTSKSTYGVTVAQYPNVQEANELADTIYKSPQLYTNTPNWTVRYRKGKSKLVNDKLIVPSQQITLSQMEKNGHYQNEDDVTKAIIDALQHDDIEPLAIKVRKVGGSQHSHPLQIAAHIFFESAYHTRSAIQTLKSLGRVSLGQVVNTARVVASKVKDVINMLLTEANGPLAKDLNGTQMTALSQIDLPNIMAQEWIDKDGRVSFIKLKLLDLSQQYFQNGESRVANLLEFVGDESECRRFYPNLVDQFDACNKHQFKLENGLNIWVKVCLSSGDHKAAWAKTGRSGGHENRDLFSDHSLASMYHLVAYQDTPRFGYERYMLAWKRIQREMIRWKQLNLEAKHITTQTEERNHLLELYRAHGRVERVPALGYGSSLERPDFYRNLLITPLVLHNQSYCNLITLELGLTHVVKPDSLKLKGLQARLKGLVDGFGTTKCSTSGTGIRNLINDCLILAQDTDKKALKYAPIWYIQDTICYHLHLKGMNTDHIHLALLDHERLCFASCTFIWWALIGDLSTSTGGRKLKNNTSKNHLENKIYGYEMTNVCPEWEEHQRIPLSLVDEAIFEASFAFRDEIINAIRSKVNIEQERKVQFYHSVCKQLAPSKRHASIMASLPRHIRHNIIIRSCWRTQMKWSFAIRTGFLPRIAKYSYHTRVTLSTNRDIHLDICGERDQFFTSEATEVNDIYIDPCGECHDRRKPNTFPIKLRSWYLIQRLKMAYLRTRLWLQKTQNIKNNHLRRATRYHTELLAELSRDVDDMDHHRIIKLYTACMLYHTKYPNDAPTVPQTATLKRIVSQYEKRNRLKDIWDGDMKDIGIPDNLDDLVNDRSWTVKRLKSVIRFFILHGHGDKNLLTLTGRRSDLIGRVKILLQQHRTMYQLPNV